MKTTLLIAPLVLAATTLLAQGPLTPPGVPAPNFKTLTQVEPRTDLQATPAPPGVDTGNASYHYIITQPGSYYLSGNLAATKNNGIRIDAAGVTLDLNGFEVSRVAVLGKGIEIAATGHRATIRNGSVRNFSDGVWDNGSVGSYFGHLSVTGHNDAGLYAIGTAAIIESCRVMNGSGTYGLVAGNGAVIVGCVVASGTHGTALGVGHGSSLTRCVAANNSADAGIAVGNGGSLTGCVAQNNTSAFTSSAGISAGANATITNCTSSDNKSTAGTPTGSTGAGFLVIQGSTIQDCTASGNRGDGIQIAGNGLCFVRNNRCHGNGLNGDGAGIHAATAFSSGNCIESNNVTGNDRGIDADAPLNLIIRNTVSSNTTNFDLVANNKVGVIVLAPVSIAISGSTGGAGVGSTDPWANLSY